MALYGSIPFMMSHKKGLTSAVLWLNAAEMWIDVEKTKGTGNQVVNRNAVQTIKLRSLHDEKRHFFHFS
jgi:mannosyl-oligosaccharide alpha-1,3-glucosidase